MALKKKGRTLISACIMGLMALLAGAVAFADDAGKLGMPECVESLTNGYGLILEKLISANTQEMMEKAEKEKYTFKVNGLEVTLGGEGEDSWKKCLSFDKLWDNMAESTGKKSMPVTIEEMDNSLKADSISMEIKGNININSVSNIQLREDLHASVDWSKAVGKAPSEVEVELYFGSSQGKLTSTPGGITSYKWENLDKFSQYEIIIRENYEFTNPNLQLRIVRKGKMCQIILDSSSSSSLSLYLCTTDSGGTSYTPLDQLGEFPIEAEKGYGVCIEDGGQYKELLMLNQQELVNLTAKYSFDASGIMSKPENVQIQLYKKEEADGNGDSETLELNSKNQWKASIELPCMIKEYDGEAGDIELYEADFSYILKGPKITFDLTETTQISLIATNVFSEPEPEKGSLKVVKQWNDKNNAASSRPKEIQVQLYQGTKSDVNPDEDETRKPYGTPKTLRGSSGSNTWSAVWPDLPQKDEQGNPYIYSVKEILPEGCDDYQVTYENNQIILSSGVTAPIVLEEATPSNAVPREEEEDSSSAQKEEEEEETENSRPIATSSEASRPSTATPSNAVGKTEQPSPKKGIEYEAFFNRKREDAAPSGDPEVTVLLGGPEEKKDEGLAVDPIPTITIINTYHPEDPDDPDDSDEFYGSLILNKRILGIPSEAWPEEGYHFTIQGLGGLDYSHDVTILGEGSVHIEGLKQGSYSITERGGAIDGYILTIDGGGTVYVKAGEDTEATVTNIYSRPGRGNLSIKKRVTGSRGDPYKDFTFRVILLNEQGEPLPETYPYTGSKEGVIASGGTIVLKHNEAVTISGLPENTKYQVEELEANQDGYTTTTSGNESGTIRLYQANEVIFYNHKPGGGGGGGGKNPPPDPTPPPTPTSPTTLEEEIPPVPETIPDRPTDLPDPNSPDAPDRFTIWDGDVPKSYVRVWNPETEEFMWIPEDEIPLASALPKTGHRGNGIGWVCMSILSLMGMGVLIYWKKREHDFVE